MTIGLDNEG